MLKQKELIDMIIDNNNEPIELWACCFYHKDPLKKILRDVHPQKVKISLQENFFKYYQQDSRIFTLQNINIRILDCNNTLLNYNGNCNGSFDTLKIFESEEECQQYYNSTIYDDIYKIELEKEKIAKSLDNRIAKLKKQFYKSDYMMEKISKG